MIYDFKDSFNKVCIYLTFIHWNKIIIFQSHLNSFPLDSNAKLIILENVASKSWLVESMKIT